MTWSWNQNTIYGFFFHYKPGWFDTLPCNWERFPVELHKLWRIMAGAVCQVRLLYLRYNIMMRWLQQQQNTGSKFESQDSKTSQHCILAHLCSRHIHQTASSLFSALAKGATKHLQRSPHNCQSCTGTIFLMTLGPLKHDKSVARLHFCLFAHITLQAKTTCLHAMTNVLEIHNFPQLDKFWKIFILYPPYLKSQHYWIAYKKSDVWLDQRTSLRMHEHTLASCGHFKCPECTTILALPNIFKMCLAAMKGSGGKWG